MPDFPFAVVPLAQGADAQDLIRFSQKARLFPGGEVFAWRLGSDDQRVMPAAGEEFGDAKDGVGDAVDVGRERFGDDRDPHGHTVRHQPIGASQPP